MSERGTSGGVGITSTDLLDSIRCSFEIATSALTQAKINLGILGFDRTRDEVKAVVEDLRKASSQLESNNCIYDKGE